MPLGWMTALKLVPWGDVIEATPQIMQAARKLLGSTQKPAAGTAPSASAAAADPLQVLHQRVLQLEEEQRASAALIQSLAEQNAQLVQAIDALRVRSQRLVLCAAGTGIVTLGLLAWAITR